jgi:signal transduction histidine kinase
MPAFALELLEIGCLILMTVYHAVLAWQVKRTYYLYMALICLAVLVRAMVVKGGSQILFLLIPALEHGWGIKLEYLASYSTMVMIPMFIHSLYYFKSHRKAIFFFKWIGTGLMVLVLFTQYPVYSQSLYLFFIILIGAFVFTFLVLLKAVRERRTGARFIVLGLVLVFGFVLLEMGKVMGWNFIHLKGPNYINTGVVVYLIFQAMALASIFARSFKENMRLSTRLEEIVESRTEQLSKSNVVKERFIRVVSHDLRGPMNNLKVMLELVDQGNLSKEVSNQLTQDISTNLDASLKLLDELVDWTATNSSFGRMNHAKEMVALSELIEDTIPLFSAGASAKGIKIVLDSSERVKIECDKNAVKVVVRNLIANAIKFTLPGGKIELKVINGINWVMFQVKDSGIGIPEFMKSTLFEMDRRNQRKGTGNERSTGIGLALCRDLVEQNEGAIWVENNPEGNGSIFKCSFPKCSS